MKLGRRAEGGLYNHRGCLHFLLSVIEILLTCLASKSSAVMRLLKSLALLAASAVLPLVDAAASQAFTWKNVRLGAGGRHSQSMADVLLY